MDLPRPLFVSTAPPDTRPEATPEARIKAALDRFVGVPLEPGTPARPGTIEQVKKALAAEIAALLKEGMIAPNLPPVLVERHPFDPSRIEVAIGEQAIREMKARMARLRKAQGGAS